jgi:hypothetical protein
MIYKAVKYILENNAALATALGTDSEGDIKVYPIHPRKEVVFPFAVFNISSLNSNPAKDLKSYGSMDEIRLRVTVYANDLDSLLNIAEKTRIAMDDRKEGGTFNGQYISSIDFDSMSDGFDQGYGDRGALTMDMEFNIWS